MRLNRIICILSVITVLSLGCQTINQHVDKTKLISNGDRVLTDFTCRLKDGGIVMTTDADLAKASDKAKASIFLPLKKYGPFSVTAGSERKGPDYGNLKSFEGAITEDISSVVVGMKIGEKGVFEIQAETLDNLTDEDRYLRLSRVVKVPKTRTINKDSYENAFGRQPVEGDTIEPKADEDISFIKVISVTDKDVKAEVTMKAGKQKDTAFGKSTIMDAGDHYEIVTDVREGSLVRSSYIVGRIIKVEGNMFTLDYGNPFGGETLICDVTSREEDSKDEKIQGQQ